MKSLFTVYSQRLAGYLMLNGFPLVDTQKNIQTGMNNFIFPNSDLLRDCIEKWQITKLSNKERN